MGYMRHNAIVVTSWDSDAINAAADKAKALGLQVLGPGEDVMNGYRSLLICPDGSKEGWTDSDDGDQRRAEFKAWTASTLYADGSGPLEWVEVEYGSDDTRASVVDSPWQAGE